MISRFSLVYEKIKQFTDSSLITKDWEGWNNGIRSELPGANDYNYIKVPSILGTMYGSPEIIMYDVAPLLAELLQAMGNDEEVRRQLYPTGSGGADEVMFDDTLTTPDLVNKAYQWLRFVYKENIPVEKIKTIVEFGGGYGAQALLINRLLPGVTYIDIDTPTVCAVAYQYLSDSLLEPVHVVTGLDDVVEGTVNLVPHGLMDAVPSADIFISQGALCECPDTVIDAVAAREFFSAKNGMMILWEHPHLIERLFELFKYTIEPFAPWKGQHHVYFSRRRRRKAAAQ